MESFIFSMFISSKMEQPQDIQGDEFIEVMLRSEPVPSLEFSVNSLEDCFPNRNFCKKDIKHVTFLTSNSNPTL